MILNYMEAGPLYNAYNFQVPSCPAINASVNLTPVGGVTSYMANTTTTHAQLNTFLCPSDIVPQSYNQTASTAAGPYNGYLSARASVLLPCARYYEVYSRRFCAAAFNGRPPQDAIFTGTDFATPIAMIKDGTSNTVMALESRIEKTSVAYGAYWGQGLWTSTHAIVYDSNPANGTSYSSNWTSTMPNGPATLAQVNPNPRQLGYAWSIGSTHPGGMNALFADGSVKFIKTSVNPPTWFGLQTMRSGEVISADSY